MWEGGQVVSEGAAGLDAASSYSSTDDSAKKSKRSAAKSKKGKKGKAKSKRKSRDVEPSENGMLSSKYPTWKKDTSERLSLCLCR